MFTMGRRRRYITLFVTLSLLIGVRLALPIALKHFIVNRLASIPSYEGKIEDVDIDLYRCAYVVKGLTLEQVGSENTPANGAPFLTIDAIELGVQWPALLDGALVSRVEMRHPVLLYVDGPAGKGHPATAVAWQEELAALVPLEINHLVVYDGEIRYVESQGVESQGVESQGVESQGVEKVEGRESARPAVSLRMADLRIEAYNLANSEERSDGNFATVDASGRPADLGSFRLHATLDPSAAVPAFDVDAWFKGVPVSRLDGLLRSRGDLSVSAGLLDLYVEATSTDGHLDGHVKPAYRSLDFIRPDREALEGTRLEAALPASGKGATTQPPPDVSTVKIPIGPGLPMDTWATAWHVLGDVAVDALVQGARQEAEANALSRLLPPEKPVVKARRPAASRSQVVAAADEAEEDEKSRSKRKLFARRGRGVETQARRGR